MHPLRRGRIGATRMKIEHGRWELMELLDDNGAPYTAFRRYSRKGVRDVTVLVDVDVLLLRRGLTGKSILGVLESESRPFIEALDEAAQE